MTFPTEPAGGRRIGEAMSRRILFVVPGEARPESKRNTQAKIAKSGKIIQPRRYDPADRKDWKAHVRHAAALAMAGPPMEGPIHVSVYVMQPPKPSWPKRPTKANRWPWAWWRMPDANNLIKPIEDACKCVVWLDDAQIVGSQQWKLIGDRYATLVIVEELGEERAEYQRAVMVGIICELEGGCRTDEGGPLEGVLSELVGGGEG